MAVTPAITTIVAGALPFVLWTSSIGAQTPATITNSSTKIDLLMSKIKALPSNEADIKAVNILNCLQDSTWRLLVSATAENDYQRLTDQAIVTRSIFQGGLGASKDLTEIRENHTLFTPQYDDWTKSESYKKCISLSEKLAAEPMPADKEGHPCRLRCQCNAVYHYVSNFTQRVGDIQKIALKNEYLDEEWILTGEYHRDFERYEIGKHIYPADMEILRTFFADCR